MDHRSGELLDGRYELIERISNGPMSRIYKAWDHRDRRFVAVKMAHDVYDDAPNVVRLQREGVALAGLRHPRIPRTFGHGDCRCEDPGYYLAVAFIQGMSLENRLSRERNLPAAEAVRVAVEVLEALEAVHRAGLMHRDVKPGNVMLTPEGAMLVDFGLVTAAPLHRARRVTSPETAVGTPNYMAPEQCRGSPDADGRADLYALGLMLYLMLTGRRAIVGDYGFEVLYAQIETPPKPFELAAPQIDLPKRLKDAVMRALEKSPCDRFRTAAHMREELLAAVR